MFLVKKFFHQKKMFEKIFLEKVVKFFEHLGRSKICLRIEWKHSQHLKITPWDGRTKSIFFLLNFGKGSNQLSASTLTSWKTITHQFPPLSWTLKALVPPPWLSSGEVVRKSKCSFILCSCGVASQKNVFFNLKSSRVTWTAQNYTLDLLNVVPSSGDPSWSSKRKHISEDRTFLGCPMFILTSVDNWLRRAM